MDAWLVAGMSSLERWMGFWVRMHLGFGCVRIFCARCLLQAEALRLADPPSKLSVRIMSSVANSQSVQTKGP